MALSRLDSLYMAVVADHSKSPHHHGVLPDVEQLQLNNPTCGDVINLSVKFDGDVIEDIAFAGDGCTISTASSSMMTDAVIGKTKAEALELAEIFSLMIQGNHKDEDKLGEAKLLAGECAQKSHREKRALGSQGAVSLLAQAKRKTNQTFNKGKYYD